MKYRSQTTRLRTRNYGWNAAYFVTICTKNREYFFGKIADGQMQLTDIGQIAEKCWNEIPQHFPFVQLGAFVVMPNHVHGIIVIDGPFLVEPQNIAAPQQPPQNIVNQRTTKYCGPTTTIPKPIQTPIQKPGIHCQGI